MTARYPDVWHRLADTRRPVAVWGTGDGADKLFALCRQRGIAVSAVFASDGFVRSRTFRGFPVMSYADVCRAYPDCIVLLAFGTRLPEVMTNVRRVASERELYIPDLPLAGDELFDAVFTVAHRGEIDCARALFDGASQKLYDGIISARLHGDITALESAVREPERHDKPDVYADIGAYDGDTIAEMFASGASPRHVIAAEPDARTYRRLEKRCASLSAEHTTSEFLLFNAAAWDKSGEVEYSLKGSRASGYTAPLGDGSRRGCVRAMTVDEMCGEERVDFIKYDVEGAEKRALRGSLRVISAFRPTLRVALYHRAGDIFSLPLMIKQMCPDYHFQLFRTPCLPCWEVELRAEI